MRPVFLIAAGAALYLAFGRAGRKLTKADLPKLAQLQLTKRYITRAVQLCAAKQAEAASKTSPTQVAGYAVGLFTGAASGDVGLAIRTARTITSGLDAILGTSDACKAEREQLPNLLATNDRLSSDLGLDRNLPESEITQIIASLGGLADVYTAQRSATWDRCVAFHGESYCTANGVPRS